MKGRPIPVRFTEETIDRFDDLAEELTRQSPAGTVTHTDVIRAACMRGLALMEAEAASE